MAIDELRERLCVYARERVCVYAREREREYILSNAKTLLGVI